MADLLATEDTQPKTIKVGDNEYTPEQVADMEKTIADKEKSYKELQSDYTKKTQKIAEYEKIGQKADDVLSGDTRASDLTQAEMDDLKYMKKLGLITKNEHEEILTKREQELEKKFESQQADKDKKSTIVKQISDLSGQHKFIKEKELAEYMAKEASEGVILTPDKAAKLLYFDDFAKMKPSPKDLPAFDSRSQSNKQEEKKIPELGSKAFNQFLRDKISQPEVE